MSSVCKFNDAGNIARIISHDYNSRVRLNSLLKIYFGENVLDYARTGTVVKLANKLMLFYNRQY